MRLRTRVPGRVITLSVHPWVCQFVSLFGYTKMSTLSEVGKHAMCTYHVRGRNEKIVVSRARASFEELENDDYYHTSMKHLGDRSSGYFTAFPATYNSEMKGS